MPAFFIPQTQENFWEKSKFLSFPHNQYNVFQAIIAVYSWYSPKPRQACGKFQKILIRYRDKFDEKPLNILWFYKTLITT